MDIFDIETTVESTCLKGTSYVVQRRLVLFSIPKLAAVLHTFWGVVGWQSLNTSSGRTSGGKVINTPQNNSRNWSYFEPMELVQSPLTIGKRVIHNVHTHTWYIIKKCPSPLVHPFLPFSPHQASFPLSDFMSQLWRKIAIKSGNGLDRGYPTSSHTHA